MTTYIKNAGHFQEVDPAAPQFVKVAGHWEKSDEYEKVAGHWALAGSAMPPPVFAGAIGNIQAIVGEAFTRDMSPRFVGNQVDTYSLQNAPVGMVIDNAGEISWPNPVKLDPPNMFPNEGFDTDILPAHGRVRGTAVWEDGKLRATTTSVTGGNGVSVGFGSGTTAVENKTYIIDFDLSEFIHTNPAAKLILYLKGLAADDFSLTPDAHGHVHHEFTTHRPASGITHGQLNVMGQNMTVGDTFLIDNFKIAEKGVLPQMTVTAHNVSGDAVSNAFGVETIALGPELFTAFFKYLPPWVKVSDTHYTIDGSQTAQVTLDGGSLYAHTFTVGKRYLIDVVVSGHVGAMKFYYTSAGGYHALANGHNKQVFTAVVNYQLLLPARPGEIISVDNVSIKEILP